MYEVVVEDFNNCDIICWYDGDYSVVDGLSADILFTGSFKLCVWWVENH